MYGIENCNLIYTSLRICKGTQLIICVEILSFQLIFPMTNFSRSLNVFNMSSSRPADCNVPEKLKTARLSETGQECSLSSVE